MNIDKLLNDDEFVDDINQYIEESLGIDASKVPRDLYLKIAKGIVNNSLIPEEIIFEAANAGLVNLTTVVELSQSTKLNTLSLESTAKFINGLYDLSAKQEINHDTLINRLNQFAELSVRAHNYMGYRLKKLNDVLTKDNQRRAYDLYQVVLKDNIDMIDLDIEELENELEDLSFYQFKRRKVLLNKIHSLQNKKKICQSKLNKCCNKLEKIKMAEKEDINEYNKVKNEVTETLNSIRCLGGLVDYEEKTSKED